MNQESRIKNRIKNQESRIINKAHDSYFILRNSTRSGFSLIEGILSAGLLGMIVTALVGLFIYGQEATRVGGDRMRAVFFAEEGMEAVRNIRDAAYANLTNGTFGVVISSDTYTLSGSSDTLPLSSGSAEVYTREIIISDESTPARKKVLSKVTWNISPIRQGVVQLENHFTDWR